jgi:adenylate cyclase
MNSDEQPFAKGELGRAKLATLIEASKLLNGTLDRDSVLWRLMILAARGVNADLATLYLIDRARRELRITVTLDETLQGICLPLDEGLAGYVARTGETVNVTDAYADPRFSRRVDDESGYHTRTVLAVPLRDPQGKIRGVVQALNKQQGVFSREDEQYLLALTEHAALALENARMHATLTADYQRLAFLYRISSLMTSVYPTGEVRLRDVLRDVIESTIQVFRAEACSILLWDQRRRQLVFVTTTSEKAQELMEITVPLEGSIAGWVFQNKQAIIVNDVQNDPRHFAQVDARTGFVTRAMICVPMKVRGKIVGVLQVMNKQNDTDFEMADLLLAQAVTNHAALAIERARHYESLLRVGEHQERLSGAGFLAHLDSLGG